MERKPKKETKAPSSIGSLDGVGKKAEKTLIEAGFDTVGKIATLDVKDLTALEGIGKKTAEKIIASAKEKGNA